MYGHGPEVVAVLDRWKQEMRRMIEEYGEIDDDKMTMLNKDNEENE